jgi:hypothetical protein
MTASTQAHLDQKVTTKC